MNNEIILYKSDDGKLSFDVKLEQNTVWLTQAKMAMLFDKDRKTITEHIGNIYKAKELSEKATCRKFQLVRLEGNRKVKRSIEHYNLDVIIGVGYRVNSSRGTQFRIWATQILKDYLLKGYSVNRHKLEAIESKIDLILKKEGLQDQQIKQLQENDAFIKKMLNPNIINNVYIDTKPLLETNRQNLEEIKAKFDELNNILNKIASNLSDKPELKKLIKTIQDNANKADKDQDAQNKVVKFIKDLGDPNSTAYILLSGAGIAKSIIIKAYELGLFLIRHLSI
ncbi:virulence RhuM family protein [Candidatus Margulisiibacteriota bacterium]